MQTVTVDIINDKALELLHDLELQQLIRVRIENGPQKNNFSSKYKGAVTKQALTDVDAQLKELRNGWE